ncbi:unnamed protein product [Rotaria socialis]|uniref:Ubiquitin-like domain-containing protein n=2 Tax=Rotaria socialis TaxID=392032 RepID=A0A820NCU9_9BILA|nr:unnamed protein product [Rotaria socialis]CAF3359613.1 unnamed protein product [Rotaria socialis]CAF3365880.1 unnamed protein product [Rotaria socialis]CAF3647864.1 unnamed protein product [Rotaria socialis]CAF4387204.1 unnamed protein product [Rotaria socialis]
MKIHIKTVIGMARTYTFEVEPSTTIRRLKELFCEKTNCEEDLLILCLIFNKEELEEDEKTLSYYNLKDDTQLDSICLGEIHRGDLNFKGSRFIDANNSKGLKRTEWSDKAPQWRRSIRGLCLEGKCLTPGCAAEGQSVVMRIGYKKFNVVADPDETTTMCPICRHFVEPTTCAFNNCWWRYEGIQQPEPNSGKPPKKCSSEWCQADDAYYYFDETTSGIVTWKSLIFEAVKENPV